MQPPADLGLEDILRGAGVSKQTFYNHFEDKNALVSELLRGARSTLAGIVKTANAEEDDPAQRVANGMAVYAAQTLVNRPLMQSAAALPVFDLAPNSPSNQAVVADLQAGLSRKRLAICSVDAGLSFLTGTTHALIHRLLLEPYPQMATPLCTQFITLLLRAFGLPHIEAELLASDAVERLVRPAVERIAQASDIASDVTPSGELT